MDTHETQQAPQTTPATPEMPAHNPWYNREKYLELLRKYDVADFISASEHTKFLAEVAWLNHWFNTELGDKPNPNDIDSIAYIEDDKLIVEFVYQAPGTPKKSAIRTIITYAPSDPISGDYELQIISDGQTIYWRTAMQNEDTEWVINAMADDPEITDEQGNMLFSGDHTNI